jgi:hypothetical protein
MDRSHDGCKRRLLYRTDPGKRIRRVTDRRQTEKIWASGNWEALISFKVFFSIGLFIFSLFIPKIIKKFKGEGK